MNERKLIWSRASNWGAIMGVIIVALELLKWGLKLGANGSFIILLLIEMAIVGIIWISGKQNVLTMWSKPYGYARSLGFVLLTLMFAGIIRGTGFFVLNQWIDPGYYTEITKQAIEEIIATPDLPANLLQLFEESKGAVARYLHNPFICMMSGVFSMLDLLIIFVPPLFLRQITPKNIPNNE